MHPPAPSSSNGGHALDGNGMSTTNGASTSATASSSRIHTNGHGGLTGLNSGALGDGNASSSSSSSQYGSTLAGPSRSGFIYPGSQIDREELVRLTLQCLNDIGYSHAASALSKESGYSLEPPAITAFRNGILEGKWETVSRLLHDEDIVQGDALSTVRFLIAEQRFLENLEARSTKKALTILRNELAVLNRDPERLHQLSSFMMCAGPAELRERSGWSGAGDASRRSLLQALQQHIPSGVMIPQRRLEALLEQAKELQRTKCRYHASDPPISLYADHVCDKSVFPSQTTHILGGHEDQVWRVQFSHSGRYLATTSKDGTALVWQVVNGFTLLHTLHPAEHMEQICAISWSPDDTTLLFGVEHAIKIYDIASGLCKLSTIGHSNHAVGGLAWQPDSKGFFSAGLDGQILCWDLEGNAVYGFKTYPYRLVDLAIAADGSRIVALGEQTEVHRSPSSVTPANGTHDTRHGIFEVKERRVIIFNLHERRQERSLPHTAQLTSVMFAPGDSRYVIINQAPNEVLLYDIIEGVVVKRYRGQQQGVDFIRSTFGGPSRGFIISGSEDSTIYVWHKDHTEPLECLQGHAGGSVNDISWNTAHPGMFASAGDDKTVRIWQAPATSGQPAE